MTHTVLITPANPKLADLPLSWAAAEFTNEDGIASLASLHEAGDAFVAVGMADDDGMTIMGSGVMVAPGLVLTATHVLDEIQAAGRSPVLFTFLPDAMRAWLPIDVAALSGPSAFYENQTISSDIALISCTLNSDALDPAPLRLAPMKVALPLLNDRLWAIGFRHEDIRKGAARVSPMLSSGVVTQAFPMGRGERMPSPCFEVAMETLGGMSGGAVVNGNGEVVGIVSSSPDGGPSYMTLIWDALRLRVEGPIPKLARTERVSLMGAHALGLARLSGDVDRNPWGEVTFNLSEAEAAWFRDSDPTTLEGSDENRLMTKEERRDFLEEWGADLESEGSLAVIMGLGRFSIEKMVEFLTAAGAPSALLTGIESFSVNDFEGVEDLEIIRGEYASDGRLHLEFFFRMLTVVWTLETPIAFHEAHAGGLDEAFLNLEVDGDIARMEFVHRAYFRVEGVFVPQAETFTDLIVTSSALIPPRRSRTERVGRVAV